MKLLKARLILATICLSVFTLQAQVHLVSAKRLIVDDRYDSFPNKTMSQVLNSYKIRLGVDVSRTIGECAQYMTVEAPESLLSDFLADQLFFKANSLIPGGVDFSVLNFGSIRSPLRKGLITVSDLYKVMPFENELVILELKGSDVLSVFKSIARSGGMGVSNVNLEIKGEKINSLLINGKVLQNDQIYRVATMDYLADGNSSMYALLKAVKRINSGLKVRDVYIEGIEKLTAEGKKIDVQPDGRIKLISE
ncbi:MAG TPA: 5'-nucleotidase [Bacteroidales bacterium]